jgi:Leucine-rich repeat (LRR) protein
MLSNLDRLTINFTNISNVNCLERLTLLECVGSKVTDVSRLSKLQILDIRNTAVTDVSMLTNLKFLVYYPSRNINLGPLTQMDVHLDTRDYDD